LGCFFIPKISHQARRLECEESMKNRITRTRARLVGEA
jgi:hypothetical protein